MLAGQYVETRPGAAGTTPAGAVPRHVHHRATAQSPAGAEAATCSA